MRPPRPSDPLAAFCPEPRPGVSEPARDRLLQAGLRLFAEHGYAKTSVRRIAMAAKTNVASVSYYFGNKAGLYRDLFWNMPNPDGDSSVGAHDAEPEVMTLDRVYRHILEPLRNDETARFWIRLRRREMLEPSGLWQEQVDLAVQPMHAALVAQLCARLEVAEADDDIHALAILVIAPAIHLLINCELVDALAPQLLAGANAVDIWRMRLLRAAEAMIGAERRRRRSLARQAATAKAARSTARRKPAKPASPTRSRSKA
jgi:hypothetical protein